MSAPPEKTHRPDNLLFRSHIEICRLLQVLAHDHSTVTALIAHIHPFKAFLLTTDPSGEHFTITFSSHKETNTLLLESPSVEFTATDSQGLHFTFEATSPEEIQIDGQPAIQFDLPRSLLLHNRREHPRVAAIIEPSLRCIADAEGFMPFESHITDVSHDGLGCLIYSTDINLEKGAVLKGSRIITPNGGAVTADLELRHVTSTTLPDGTAAHRAGFKFIQRPSEIATLIDLFIQDLDKK